MCIIPSLGTCSICNLGNSNGEVMLIWLATFFISCVALGAVIGCGIFHFMIKEHLE